MTGPDQPPNTAISARDLLPELALLYKIQPATALWRAVEIAEVLREGLPAGTGLDVGCGDGALTGMILRHLDSKPDLIGLDNDPGEVAVADRRGVYSQTICSGGEAIPLDDSSVDFVFSNSVLEHIPKLEETISECSRILRPGGVFIATVPAPAFRDLLSGGSSSAEARKRYLDKMDARLAHHNYLDEAAWQTLLARQGLDLTYARGYFNAPQVRRWERFSRMTAGLLQAFGASNSILYRLQRFTRSDDPTAGGLLSEERKPPGWSKMWARMVAGRVLGPAAATDDAEPMACLLIRAEKPAVQK